MQTTQLRQRSCSAPYALEMFWQVKASTEGVRCHATIVYPVYWLYVLHCLCHTRLYFCLCVFVCNSKSRRRTLMNRPMRSSVVVKTFFQVSRPRPRPRPGQNELECTRVSRPWSRDHNTDEKYMTCKTDQILLALRITMPMKEFKKWFFNITGWAVLQILLIHVAQEVLDDFLWKILTCEISPWQWTDLGAEPDRYPNQRIHELLLSELLSLRDRANCKNFAMSVALEEVCALECF